MRTLAIGDIHGHLAALDALLDAARPGPDDLLITLGDYVDRGPDSKGVLDRLVELFEGGRLVALLGNHDQMMVRSRFEVDDRRLWLRCGGIETLASYRHWPGDEEYDRVPERHWEFLQRNCVEWHETATHLYVHGGLDPALAMREQETAVLLWAKLTGPLAHQSGKVVICGHTRQTNGVPLNLGCTVCIDTAIYDPTGWLTCLHVEAGTYWQANAAGEVRQGRLPDPPA